MTRDADLLRLAQARRLLASGYVREVRLAHGLTLRGCAEVVGGVSDVSLLRWETAENVPRRNIAAALRYVDLIQRVAGGRDAA